MPSKYRRIYLLKKYIKLLNIIWTTYDILYQLLYTKFFSFHFIIYKILLRISNPLQKLFNFEQKNFLRLFNKTSNFQSNKKFQNLLKPTFTKNMNDENPFLWNIQSMTCGKNYVFVRKFHTKRLIPWAVLRGEMGVED